MEKNVPEAQKNGMRKSTVGGDVARGLGQLGAQSLVLKGTQALEAMEAMEAMKALKALKALLALPVEAVQLIPGAEGGFLCDTPCFLWTLLYRVQPPTLEGPASDLG